MSGEARDPAMHVARVGISEEKMPYATERSTALMRRMPGYIGRDVSYSVAACKWTDLVSWDSAKAADAALATFGLHDEARELTRSMHQATSLFLRLDFKMRDEAVQSDL